MLPDSSLPAGPEVGGAPNERFSRILCSSPIFFWPPLLVSRLLESGGVSWGVFSPLTGRQKAAVSFMTVQGQWVVQRREVNNSWWLCCLGPDSAHGRIRGKDSLPFHYCYGNGNKWGEKEEGEGTLDVTAQATKIVRRNTECTEIPTVSQSNT